MISICYFVFLLLQSHEFDECRFDVAVNSNCIWYLRAETPEDKRNWVEVLESYKSDAIAQQKYQKQREQSGLARHDSTISLQSTTASTGGREVNKTNTNIKEKLNEIETLKNILYNQVNTLQR